MRVVVTRPAAAAALTVGRLRRAGLEAVALPLTEIVALRQARLPEMDGVAALAVTSANALVHASAALVERLQGPPLHAVGRRTAKAAASRGFPAVRAGPGTAAALAAELGTALPPGSRVIYLCGRLRKPEFEAQLGAAGVAVQPVETYDTRRVPPAATAAHARSIGPVDAVLVYSSEAAASLEALTREAGLAELFAAARFCCLSPRIAAVLAGVDPARIGIAPQPTEDSLFALLETES